MKLFPANEIPFAEKVPGDGLPVKVIMWFVASLQISTIPKFEVIDTLVLFVTGVTITLAVFIQPLISVPVTVSVKETLPVGVTTIGDPVWPPLHE